jgi:hypothetical protein
MMSTAPRRQPDPPVQAVSRRDRFLVGARLAAAALARRVARLMPKPRTPYLRVLFWTFPRYRAERLAVAPRADVEAAAPKPFAEVFGDATADAARPNLGVTILGPVGIAALFAALVTAAVLVDSALLTPPAAESPSPGRQQAK